jgi:hypothetical protein
MRIGSNIEISTMKTLFAMIIFCEGYSTADPWLFASAAPRFKKHTFPFYLTSQQ